jgi:hypothetical protein
MKMVRFYFDVYRDLGSIESTSEPGWRCHALDSAGLKRMPQQWEAWMGFRNSTGAQWEQSPAPTYLERLGTSFKKRVANLKDKFIP